MDLVRSTVTGPNRNAQESSSRCNESQDKVDQSSTMIAEGLLVENKSRHGCEQTFHRGDHTSRLNRFTVRLIDQTRQIPNSRQTVVYRIR